VSFIVVTGTVVGGSSGTILELVKWCKKEGEKIEQASGNSQVKKRAASLPEVKRLSRLKKQRKL
jgi:hypothetical protein